METNWVEEFEKKRSVLRQNENGKLQNHPKYKELMAKIEAEMEGIYLLYFEMEEISLFAIPSK